MRDDVIKQIGDLKNINHIVVLTHNIDFIFLQTVFLSALKRCGHPSLTVYADEQCARQSYKYQSSLLTGLGKRFRVVPVSMNPGYRFHPKAIFLAGDDRAVLFVGSGNLTFGGLRENAEIWNRFDTQNNDFGVIASFKKYLTEVTNRVPFKESVQSELMELFDAQSFDWVNQLSELSGLIGRVGEANSLMSQMQSVLGESPISKITVSVPYFDPEAKALGIIAERYPDAIIEVFIQSRKSTLFSEAEKNLASNIKLKSIVFADPEDKEGRLDRFIHGKYFAFHHGNHVDVFAGSANCSIAALVKGGSEGNAELMVHRKMNQEEFVDNFLTEFIIVDEAPELVSNQEIESEDVCAPRILLLAARYDLYSLRVSLKYSKGVKLTECLVDGELCEYEINDFDELVIRTVNTPSTLLLKGLDGNQGIQSNKIWVDQESLLRSTSKGRALLEKIRSSDTGQAMEAEDWMLVVELFAKDLEYTTANDFHRNNNKNENTEETNETFFSRSDVFSNSYDQVPDFSGRMIGSLNSDNISIYKLLLHAFGGSSENHKISNQFQSEEIDDEDIVDQPEKFDTKPPLKTKKVEVSKHEKHRIIKVVNAIVETFTDQDYLELRDPVALGRDLQLAGLVLRKGLSESWLEKDHFFEATQNIWAKLFLSIKPKEPKGWLGIRYQKEEDKEQFRQSLASTQLAATLFAWAMAIDFNNRDIFTQRFLSTLLLSMGRFSWLWHDDLDKEEIYFYLKKIIQETSTNSEVDIDINSLHKKRISLLRQGISLANIDAYLSKQNLVTLRNQLNDKDVKKGDILWQGNRGICIALSDTSNATDSIEVLSLQDPENRIKFKKEFLIPIQSLIKEDLIPKTENFGKAQVNEVLTVLDQLKLMHV